MGPTNYGEAYRPRGRTDAEWTHMDRVQEQKNLEEAEDLDVNAAIHGNWTVENAKSKLHQFMQANKINADYKYTQVGPDHSRLVLMKLELRLFSCLVKSLCIYSFTINCVKNRIKPFIF